MRATATRGAGSDEEQSAATKYFLDMGERDEIGEETKTLQLNTGTRDDPRWIDWTVKPVGIDTMRAIRRKATQSREAKRTGTVDEYRINLAVVVAGTVDPNIREVTATLSAKGKVPNDPVEALKMLLQNKPGYVAQIAGEIMSISGFDDDDVQEADAVAAAGNS